MKTSEALLPYFFMILCKSQDHAHLLRISYEACQGDSERYERGLELQAE